jgi:hypothetical protein
MYCNTFPLVYLCSWIVCLIFLYAQVGRMCGCEWDRSGLVTKRQDVVQIWLPFYLERVGTGAPAQLRRRALLIRS